MRSIVLALMLGAITGSAHGQAASQDLVVSTAWLAERLDRSDIVVLHVAHGADYDQAHIPGARKLEYGSLVVREGTLGTELPPAEQARAVFEALGVSDGSTVVVYAHQAPMATRALFTLAYLGVARIAYLDGGLERWRAESRPVSTEPVVSSRGRITSAPNPALVAAADWLEPRLSQSGVSLIDTRTDGEYNGTGNRSGMPSAGHLAGARQLEWEAMFSDGNVLLKPRAELESIFRERVSPGDTVVTYCWVGFRASATWFVARYLGYDARLYDGSYQDWSQRKLPTRAGTTP
ncbi:MAG: sulfurtransferase [Gemmatimonadales bacterium]